MRGILPILLFALLAGFGCRGAVATEPTTVTEEAPAIESRAEATPRGSTARVAAPEWLPCDRNEVTSFIGRVTSFERTGNQLRISIATDWDTTETVPIEALDPRRHFRIDAEPFTSSDWSRIESRPGVLRPEMRVNAWVCANGSTVLDWRPGDEQVPGHTGSVERTRT